MALDLHRISSVIENDIDGPGRSGRLDPPCALLCLASFDEVVGPVRSQSQVVTIVICRIARGVV